MKNQNHPPPGSKIAVSPIRFKKDIKAIKKILKDEPRNLAMFTLGINTALRASDLLKLTYGQLASVKEGEFFNINEKKTAKKRFVTINQSSCEVIKKYLKYRPKTSLDSPFFLSQKWVHGRQITTSSLNQLVKKWCHEINLDGNYGSHTLRKTFGYHQRVNFKVDIPTLMVAFNHSTQAQTLAYLGIQDEDVYNVFMNNL
ncbi:MAG: tyrosine-type recombinase/integrase [Oligoflexales bacterium]